MGKNLFFAAACAAAFQLWAAPVRMPLEWNPTYDTSVPYEVEISPAKLQKLAGADPSAGFAVTAQTAAGAKQLDVVTLPGRVKGTVRLRFTVPEKTTSLSCAVEGAKASPANTAAVSSRRAPWRTSSPVRSP